MRRFGYARPSSVAAAVAARDGDEVRFIAGGTNLVDLMKSGVERPAELVDINALPLAGITDRGDGGLRLGALATNAETAYDPRVVGRYPVLSSAILAGASAQLRNAATNGGNINQRTRCYYFVDVEAPCNKRAPGSGCGAIGGYNRIHAILGASGGCIATHPSDMCVALLALDAEVRVARSTGERVIRMADYHRLPGDQPWLDNTLQPGELVTAIDLPPGDFSANYTYLKMRDRLSYAFALVSVAVVMQLDGDRIVDARIALGGVAHKPWRVREAEALLTGAPAEDRRFAEAADALLAGAAGQGSNDFKIDLGRRAIVRACQQASSAAPQSNADKRIA